MKRQIIYIDEEKCIGCGKCATACHEGAIDIIEGKAHLSREHFCDGLGDCLPSCPVDAIHFETREAPPYDEEAVLKSKQEGCKSSSSSSLNNNELSCLSMWPIKMKLTPVDAPYFDNASLLISADCASFAYKNFHEDFMKGKVTLICCPKLDKEDYSDKLSQIFKYNNIKDITLVTMEVPCCSKLINFVNLALEKANKNIPIFLQTITLKGECE